MLDTEPTLDGPGWTKGTNMTVIRFTKRADFIAALEARRPWAKAWDAEVTAEHKAAEKAYLAEYRQKLRDRLKMPYADIAAMTKNGNYRATISWEGPGCPRLTEPRLDKVLHALSFSRQEQFNLTDDRWGEAFWLLTHDQDAVVTPC